MPDPDPDAQPARARTAARAVAERGKSFLFMENQVLQSQSAHGAGGGACISKCVLVTPERGSVRDVRLEVVVPSAKRSPFYVLLMDSSPGEGLPGR